MTEPSEKGVILHTQHFEMRVSHLTVFTPASTSFSIVNLQHTLYCHGYFGRKTVCTSNQIFHRKLFQEPVPHCSAHTEVLLKSMQSLKGMTSWDFSCLSASLEQAQGLPLCRIITAHCICCHSPLLAIYPSWAGSDRLQEQTLSLGWKEKMWVDILKIVGRLKHKQTVW